MSANVRLGNIRKTDPNTVLVKKEKQSAGNIQNRQPRKPMLIRKGPTVADYFILVTTLDGREGIGVANIVGFCYPCPISQCMGLCILFSWFEDAVELRVVCQNVQNPHNLSVSTPVPMFESALLNIKLDHLL